MKAFVSKRRRNMTVNDSTNVDDLSTSINVDDLGTSVFTLIENYQKFLPKEDLERFENVILKLVLRKYKKPKLLDLINGVDTPNVNKRSIALITEADSMQQVSHVLAMRSVQFKSAEPFPQDETDWSFWDSTSVADLTISDFELDPEPFGFISEINATSVDESTNATNDSEVHVWDSNSSNDSSVDEQHETADDNVEYDSDDNNDANVEDNDDDDINGKWVGGR